MSCATESGLVASSAEGLSSRWGARQLPLKRDILTVAVVFVCGLFVVFLWFFCVVFVWFLFVVFDIISLTESTAKKAQTVVAIEIIVEDSDLFLSVLVNLVEKQLRASMVVFFGGREGSSGSGKMTRGWNGAGELSSYS